MRTFNESDVRKEAIRRIKNAKSFILIADEERVKLQHSEYLDSDKICAVNADFKYTGKRR